MIAMIEMGGDALRVPQTKTAASGTFRANGCHCSSECLPSLFASSTEWQAAFNAGYGAVNVKGEAHTKPTGAFGSV
jgi:hypothetical protein